MILMNRTEIEALIDRTAIRTAEQTIKQLKKSDKLKHNFTNSFRKTEELAPGASQELLFRVPLEQLAAFDDSGKTG